MRAFVLTSGRTGSQTWAKACQRLTSHTVDHEGRAHRVAGRLSYPDNHISVDNRLSWFTGLLDERYGDRAVYVHLTRDAELTAASYARRYNVRAGIAPAFASGVIRQTRQPTNDRQRYAAARLMVDVVRANVELFLRDKSKVVRVDIDDPHDGFTRMVTLLGADGDLDAAHRELNVRHNQSRRR